MNKQIIYTFINMESAEAFNFSKKECLIDFLKQNNYSHSKEDDDGELGWNDFINGVTDIEFNGPISYSYDITCPILFKTILHDSSYSDE